MKATYVSDSPSHHPISFREGKYVDYVIILKAHVFSTIIHEVPTKKFDYRSTELPIVSNFPYL